MTEGGLTFGSLFTGIGGLDLGLQRAGWDCRWMVEWESFPMEVLNARWWGVKKYWDATELDYSQLEQVDLIAGGFPCQPVSAAGRQQAQADERWLWPTFERAIRQLRPRHVLVENVRNLLRANGGSAMGDVLGGLAQLGYDAEWGLLSARDVGAPHRRERVWILASLPDATGD